MIIEGLANEENEGAYADEAEASADDVDDVLEAEAGEAETDETHEADESDEVAAEAESPLEETEFVSSGGAPATLIVIDSRIEGYEQLLIGLPESAHILIVDGGQSGLGAISSALAHGQFDAIHIYSHGTPGSFTLGTDTVASDTLTAHGATLSGWADYLTEDADILLYGCDIAQGEQGQLFISQLAHLTGADIAASTNATGSADQGGDWVLESRTGGIEAGVLAVAGYGGLLDGTPADVTVAGTDKESTVAEDTAGNVGAGITVSGGKAYTATFSAGSGTLSALGATGDAAAINAALANLTYSYTGAKEVGDTDTLSITIDDGEGGTSIFTRTIKITAENDAPIVTTTGTPAGAGNPYVRLQVNEGSAVSFDAVTVLDSGGTSGLGAWQKNIGLHDPDNKAEQIIIKIKSLPTRMGGGAEGKLTLNGVELVAGATFSLDEINNLKYEHDGTQVTTTGVKVSFQITIDDGAGGLIQDQDVFIDLLPVNQQPSISGGITVIQGEGRVNLGTGGNLPVIGGSRGQLTGVDDEGETLAYQIESVPAVGRLYYGADKATAIVLSNDSSVANLGWLWYEYPKNLEPSDSSVDGKVEFQIKVTDQGGGEAGATNKEKTETITIVVLDNNNDPYFGQSYAAGANPLDVSDLTAVGGDPATLIVQNIDYATATKTDNTIVITTAMLPLVDADSAQGARVYTIVGSNHATAGYFTVDDKLLARVGSDYATFTQADVEAGKVKYHLFGNGPAGGRIDYIDFTVKDGAKTIVFDDAGGGYARNGGIYTAAAQTATSDPTDAGLQKFRLQVQVPESAEGGTGDTLPDLPAMAAGIAIGTNTTLTLNESGQFALQGHLSATDTGIGSPADKIVFRIEKAPEHGTLYRGTTALKLHDSFTQAEINDGTITYKHGGDERFTDYFHFSVSNGDIVTASATNKFDFDITPQNDSPEASGADVAVAEGKAVEIVINLSDPDNDGDRDKTTGYATANTVGYRVDTVPAHGKLYLVDAAGFDVADYDYTNTDGLTAITANTVFQPADLTDKKLIYVHNGTENYKDGGGSINFKITPIDSAQVAINPDGTTDGTTASDATNKSSAGGLETINITVTPRNDAPQFVAKAEATDTSGSGGSDKRIREGEEFTIWGATYAGGIAGKTGSGTATAQSEDHYLVYQDSDNTSVQRQYRVTVAPQYGTLTLNGTPLGVGSVFTQADLDAGNIKYKHDGSENHADHFDYVVSDGDWTSNDGSKDAANTKEAAANAIYVQGTGKNDITASRYNIEIKPTNDIPTIKFQNGSAGTDWFIIDSTTTAQKLPTIILGDVDISDGTGNQDFVQVTVEFLGSDGSTPYTAGVFSFEGADASNPEGAKVTSNASGKVEFQGTLENVQKALDKLHVKVNADDASNPDSLKIKVTIDDQLRNESGTLTNDANGGDANEEAGKTDISDANNRVSIIMDKVAVSTVNNPPAITAPAEATVKEDIRSQITGISFTDPDAFNSSNNTLTLTVSQGKLYFSTSGTSVTGGASVDAGSVGSSTVTLKGTKAQLDAALASLYYLSPENYNGTSASTTDATLSVAVNDNGNTGADSGTSTDSKTVNIKIDPVNDKPTVTMTPAGPMALTPGAVTNITGISVGDIDIRGDITTNGANDLDTLDNEADFVQVTVRVVQKVGSDWSNPTILASSVYNDGATSSITIGSSASVSEDSTFDIDATYNGTNSALVIRGEIDKVNAYLAGLTLRMEGTTLSNADTRYGLQVIVDDRVRDSSDSYKLKSNSPANGGQNPNATSNPTGVVDQPTNDMADPYSAIPAAALTHNVASAIRELLPSDVNDPARILHSLSATEGSNDYVTLAALEITDPDALETDTLKATVTLPTGFTIQNVGSGGGSFTGSVGGSSFTIEGTLAQINARLDSLRIALPDVAGDAAAADWNGSFDVTVVVEDLGNNGARPGSLPTTDGGQPIGTNETTGVFTYADSGEGSTDNKLVTTRTVTFTVNPTNDAPVAKQIDGKREASLGEMDEDPGYQSTDVAGSNNTVDDLFSPYFDDSKDEIKNNQVAGATADTGTNADTFWGVAVVGNTANATTQGVWQYHNGTVWVEIPTTVANGSALILAKDTPLRFNPVANYFGEPGKLTVRLIETNDNSDTSTTASVPASDTTGHNIGTPGGTSRYSSDAVTLGIKVNNVNDRPTVNAGGKLTVTEDIGSGDDNAGVTVGSLSASTYLNYSDATDGAEATPMGGIAIVGNTADATTEGVWQYKTASGSWTAVGTVSDAGALVLPTDASLRFVPVADYNGTPPGLTVRVADSTQVFATGVDLSLDTTESNNASSTWSLTTTLGAEVTPQNDAPAFSNTATNPTATEPAGTGSNTNWVKLLNTGSNTVSDIDLGTTSALSSGVFGAGSVTVALTDGIAGDSLQLDTLTAGGNGIASISGGSNGANLVVTFTNAATLAEVQAVLEAIQYRHQGDDPTAIKSGTARSTLAYSITLSDGINAGDGGNAQTGGNAGGPQPLTASKSGSITLTPANDPPVAVDDTNTMRRLDDNVSGNLIDATSTNGAGTPNATGTPDSDPDTPTADLRITHIKTTTAGVTSPDDKGVTSTGETEVQGKYGTLYVKQDGSYRYELNPDHPDVLALPDDGSNPLAETFEYTLSDQDAVNEGTDTATLSITVTGAITLPPTITTVDKNTAGDADGHITVYESGLPTGSEASTDKETATGEITFTADGGLQTITINGIDLSVSELNNLGSTPKNITIIGLGTLTLTGFDTATGDPSAPRSGTLHYSFTLTDEQAHTAAGNDAHIVDVALKVKDQQNTEVSGILKVQVVDDVPTAKPDTGTLKAGDNLTGSVLTNDQSGADGWAMSGSDVAAVVGIKSDNSGGSTGIVGSSLQGEFGTLTLLANGSYTYTANADAETGDEDVFTYTVEDGDGDQTTATLTLTIQNNQPPVANDDAATTPEDTPVSGNVITGGGDGDVADSDPEGDPLTVTKITVNGTDTSIPNDGSKATITFTEGSLEIDKDGNYTFTPTPDWNGNVPVITYTIDDGKGGTDTADLKITVTPVVDIVDDSASTPVNTPRTINVLTNDIFDGDNPQITSTTDGSHGTVTFDPSSKSVVYTPNPGYVGEDTFTYTVTSGGVTETATVTINVYVPNAIPTAEPDSYSTDSDKPVVGDLGVNDLLGDGDASSHTWAKASDPEHGTVTLNPDGSFTYTPDEGFSGEDSFTYTLTDVDGDSSTATVTINVNGVPVANPDTVSTPGNTPVSGDLSGNDIPSSDGGNVWSKTSDPANGKVTVNPDGSYTYTPDEGFEGEDSFTYTVTDKDGDRSTTTVTITVEASSPTDPAPPVDPEEPSEPSEPESPVTPEEPEVPVTPEEPGAPQEPLQPVNPELPNFYDPNQVPTPPAVSAVEPERAVDLDRPGSQSPEGVVGSPVIMDAGPFYSTERHDDVRRMTLPFHPIVYVNREVAVAQALRAQDDTRSFSNPGSVERNAPAPSSLGMTLGQDPNLFVVQAVRESQQTSSALGNSIDGRYSRLSLGSDGLLPQPGLFRSPEIELLDPFAEKAASQRPASSAQASEGAADDQMAEGETLARGLLDQEAPEGSDAEIQPLARAAAPSFAEQLRRGASRLPMAARSL